MIQVLMVVIQGENIQSSQLFKKNLVMSAEMCIHPQILILNTPLYAPHFKTVKILWDLLCFEKLKFILYD